MSTATNKQGLLRALARFKEFLEVLEGTQGVTTKVRGRISSMRKALPGLSLFGWLNQDMITAMAYPMEQAKRFMPAAEVEQAQADLRAIDTGIAPQVESVKTERRMPYIIPHDCTCGRLDDRHDITCKVVQQPNGRPLAPTLNLRRLFDNVEHPAHYGGADNPYEAIKVIEAWSLGFCLGNCLKYISRAGRKDAAKELEDLKKARWYLDREISSRSPKQPQKP
jgi:hypothetical protein